MKSDRTATRRQTGPILCGLLRLVVVALLASAGVALGRTPAAPPMDVSFAAAADYVLNVGPQGVVTATSGRTGACVARGPDAAAVIQHTIDLLPASGGKIYLGAGSYRLSRTIVIKDRHGVHLAGAARGMHGPGKAGTVLWSDRPINLVEIFGDSYRVFGVTVSNLLLYGSGRDNGKAGIFIHGTTDVLTLYNVGANNCGIGFYFQGGPGKKSRGMNDAPQVYFCDPQRNGSGIVIERCHYGKFVGGEVSDNTDYGIKLSCPDARRQSLQGLKLMSLTAVRNGKAGILVGRHVSDITIGGGTDVGGSRTQPGILLTDEGSGLPPTNIIIDGIHAYNNARAAIAVEQARHVIIQGCILSVHRHPGVHDRGQDYGVVIGAGADDVVLTGNICYGNRVAGVLRVPTPGLKKE